MQLLLQLMLPRQGLRLRLQVLPALVATADAAAAANCSRHCHRRLQRTREAQCVRLRVRVDLNGRIVHEFASKGAEASGPRSAMKVRT